MNDPGPLPVPDLTGPRVRLRALAARDVDALYALHSDPRVMRYWSFPAWSERSQATGYIERIAREREIMEFYPWAATLPDGDRLVGTCSLSGIRREPARGVIGYALVPDLWGRGIAGDMLQLALGFAFDTLGLDCIEADIDLLNFASCRLAERTGFRCAGCRREYRRSGGARDIALYGLLRPDWSPSGPAPCAGAGCAGASERDARDPAPHSTASRSDTPAPGVRD